MNVAKRRVLVIVMLAAALVLTHCRQERPSEKISDKVNQLIDKTEKRIGTFKDLAEKKVEGAGMAIDDATITTRIKAEILDDPLLRVASIEVATIGGGGAVAGRCQFTSQYRSRYGNRRRCRECQLDR